MEKRGILYVVATPIGNLEDISLRALRILREADLIACEDTRHTARLLNHYGITTPCESHHEHNEAAHTPRLLDMLQEGKNIALVSDAGTPLLSDPGYTLVSGCRERGLAVVPIPGPSAIAAALAGSGLPTDSFFFAGFLPSRQGMRRKRLREMTGIRATLVFYEAPHRLLAALEDMTMFLGDRQACVARELTKIHEEWLHGTLPELLAKLRSRPQVRGEITLVVDRGEQVPCAGGPSWPKSISSHLREQMEKTGASQKEALKAVARERGISRKDAYRQLLNDKQQQTPGSNEETD